MAKKKNPEDIEGGGLDATDGDVAGDTFEEEPDFSDPEDFVDDISDEELMPEIMKQMPKVSTVYPPRPSLCYFQSIDEWCYKYQCV